MTAGLCPPSEKAPVAKNWANKEKADSQEQLEGDSWGTAGGQLEGDSCRIRMLGPPKRKILNSLVVLGTSTPLFLPPQVASYSRAVERGVSRSHSFVCLSYSPSIICLPSIPLHPALSIAPTTTIHPFIIHTHPSSIHLSCATYLSQFHCHPSFISPSIYPSIYSFTCSIDTACDSSICGQAATGSIGVHSR